MTKMMKVKRKNNFPEKKSKNKMPSKNKLDNQLPKSTKKKNLSLHQIFEEEESKSILSQDEEVEEEMSGEDSDASELSEEADDPFGDKKEDQNDKVETTKELADTFPGASDPLNTHFSRTLTAGQASRVYDPENWVTDKISWPALGVCRHFRPTSFTDTTGDPNDLMPPPDIGTDLPEPNGFSFDNCSIKKVVHKNLLELTPLQEELLSLLSSYKDLHYPYATHDKYPQISQVMAAHVVNHCLKANALIKHNDIAEKAKDNCEEYQDQGYTKPKVVVLMPTRHSVYRFVTSIMKILDLQWKDNDVKNYERFLNEFGPTDEKKWTKKSKPEDFRAVFEGNQTEDFRMGIKINAKNIKAFSGFHCCDVVLASPLGLRSVTGVSSEAHFNADFLSSVEMLILDQAEVLALQNWEHVMIVLENMNQPIKESKNITCNFARIREWISDLEDEQRCRLYRQTVVFASTPIDYHIALIRRQRNFAGRLEVHTLPKLGSLPQIFIKCELTMFRAPGNSDDDRFKFFTTEVLPRIIRTCKQQILLYVVGNYDYVRLHSFLSSERIVPFSTIHEDSIQKPAQIAGAKSSFKKGTTRLLLYSERFHFYMRDVVKGVRHLVCYELPSFPHFLPEIANMMTFAKQNPELPQEGLESVSVVYQNDDRDILKMTEFLGRDAKAIMKSSKTHHHTTINQ